MQLILGQEGEPVDAILLILPQFGVDLHRQLVLLDLRTVEKLTEELSFALSSLQQVVREPRRVRQPNLNPSVSHDSRHFVECTDLEWNHLDERCKSIGCRGAYVVVRVAHATKNGDHHEDDVGQGFDVQAIDNI